MSRVLFAWKCAEGTEFTTVGDANIPLFKTGPWYYLVAYRVMMWWQSVGFDVEEWLSRRLGEEIGQ